MSDYRLELEPGPEVLSAAAALRHRVFVLEQGVDPLIERDGRDAEALHVAVHGPADQVVATGRLMIQGEIAKVQRVAVSPELRRGGAGRLVMDGLESLAATRGITTVRLSSQQSAVPFYERLGYVCEGEPYLEAGIVHRLMSKSMESAP